MDVDEEKIILLSLLYYLHQRKKKKRKQIDRFTSDGVVRSSFYPLFNRLREDDDKFFEYLRMTRATFDELFDILKNNITKKNTLMKDSIPPEERLVITLRYLATGCSFGDLHTTFHVGRSTASEIVRKVCEAIWTCMASKTFPVKSTEDRLKSAAGLEKNSDFPHCVGAIDGKRIHVTQPPDTSVVLLAVCDADYLFTDVDIGSYKKFKNSSLYEKIRNRSLNIPDPAPLGDSSIEYPYVIVGNQAFALSENLLRPYGGVRLAAKKRIFNYRLSRARKYSECSFGILANKWRIFHKPLVVDIGFAESIVRASCVLHNFVHLRDGARDKNIPTCSMESLADEPARKGNPRAQVVRDNFADYFVDVAPLGWQETMIGST